MYEFVYKVLKIFNDLFHIQQGQVADGLQEKHIEEFKTLYNVVNSFYQIVDNFHKFSGKFNTLSSKYAKYFSAQIMSYAAPKKDKKPKIKN